MSHLPLVPLGEVLTQRSARIALEPDETYAQITAKLWGKGLVLRGLVKGSEIAADQQVRVEAGQFLISKIDARHGAFGIVPSELDGAVVSNDFPAFDVTADRALPAYISWVGRTDWFVALCRRASEGSTNRVRLKEARFLAQEIPLPPLQEQRRIVDRLDAAASRATGHRQAAADVEAGVNAALASAFRRIVEGAPRARMGDIAPLVRRHVAIEPDEIYTEIGVRSFYRGLFPRRSIKGDAFDWQKLFRVDAGDLVFSNLMAWERGIGLAGPEHSQTVGNHRMLTCEVDRAQATPEFLFYYFNTAEGFEQVVAASPGTMVRNKTLSTKLLPSITVPAPSLDAQQWFDLLQVKARAVRAAQAEAASHLSQLLPALLDESFDA
jgi:type I restriction enzyme S subunit